MPITVVLGCQWGDEGKGKIVDLLAADADWVARFQGGANAGHTVYLDGRKAVLHQVPTGILRPAVRCAIGNGVVLDPLALLEELRQVEELGVSWRSRLAISPRAHLVTPLHKAIEKVREQDRTIGTTGRGIGPAYEDKAGRRGLRAEALADPRTLAERLRELWEACERATGGRTRELCALASAAALVESFAAAAAELGPLLADVTDLLLDADDAGGRVLCEGAQGTLLDLDHGTYPYVTSSNTSIGGVCTGLGLPPRRIRRVVGVVKAYTTRVGLGPFPTEFTGRMADEFRERAGEYGATTGRPRRCGWFDAFLVKRSARLNGVDALVVTKLDVLAGVDPLRMAIGRDRHGEPVYAELAGWQGDLGCARSLPELPPTARAYLERIATEAAVPVALVSVGPEREQVFSTGA